MLFFAQWERKVYFYINGFNSIRLCAMNLLRRLNGMKEDGTSVGLGFVLMEMGIGSNRMYPGSTFSKEVAVVPSV